MGVNKPSQWHLHTSAEKKRINTSIQKKKILSDREPCHLPESRYTISYLRIIQLVMLVKPKPISRAKNQIRPTPEQIIFFKRRKKARGITKFITCVTPCRKQNKGVNQKPTRYVSAFKENSAINGRFIREGKNESLLI